MSSSSPTPAPYNGGLNPADYKPGSVAPCAVCGKGCFKSTNPAEGFRCSEHTFAAIKLAELEAESKAKPKSKHKTKKPLSMTIQLQEIADYEWNPSMRYLLMIIHLGTRRKKDDYEDTWAPTGWTAEEMVGWCDMAQWRIAGRLGLTPDHTGRMLRQLEADGWIEIEGWTDPDTNMLHCRYRIIAEKVMASQRKEWSPTMRRGSRYNNPVKPRKANKGSFNSTNQPGKSAQRKAIEEMDDE
jgi:hypothetical protein